jgi:UDP-N-acetylmuramate dehydrogenase
MEVVTQQDVPLAPYTTLKVGGVANYFVVVREVEEVRVAWRQAEPTAMPPFILGGGSNVLISDGPLRRLVIKNEIKGVSFEECADGTVLAKAGAGDSWDELVETTANRGLSGLENLSGIPGTVGAAPVQNINAYGATVAEVIESVEVYDGAADAYKTLGAAECRFGYRDSIFKRPEGKSLVVLFVTFRLTKAAVINISYRSSSQSIERYLAEKNITTPTVVDVRGAVLHTRSNIGMLLGQFQSAGSFFKNTVVSAEEFSLIETVVKNDFADISERLSPWHWSLPSGEGKIATAFLLECSPYNKHTYGTKRFRDAVGISPLHSLSIVTFAGATATDVQDFVEEIKHSVKNIFGVTLETEVDYISH